MKNNAENTYLLRDKILNLLSDADVAIVSTAETAPTLVAGAEYLDLENFARGVQVATAAPTPVGQLLPRAAVPPETWNKIVTLLPEVSVL